MRKIIYREVPKPPGPTGEIGVNLWRALCDRVGNDYNEYEEIYVGAGHDIAWLEGYSAATDSDEEKREIRLLIQAISLLGQVEVVWVNE